MQVESTNNENRDEIIKQAIIDSLILTVVISKCNNILDKWEYVREHYTRDNYSNYDEVMGAADLAEDIKILVNRYYKNNG